MLVQWWRTVLVQHMQNLGNLVATQHMIDCNSGASRVPGLELRVKPRCDTSWSYMAMAIFMHRYIVESIVRICSD